MSKTKIGKFNSLFPMLPVLVGTNVNGKPNYITIGLIGWLCYDTVSISLEKDQYSNTGLEENKTFSINQPSTSLIKELDYCGLVSGKKVDKSSLFTNFYGDLKTAPMIEECPVNIECRVIDTIKRPVHTVYIGEINEAYVNENYLTDDIIDMQKLDPVLYNPVRPKAKVPFQGSYWRLGEYSGPAWTVGKELQP